MTKILVFILSNRKVSDWIRLVFAHPFPLNSGAPIASGNFISDGKAQVSPYLAIPLRPCPTNGGSVIQDQRVGTIQLLFQSEPFFQFLWICKKKKSCLEYVVFDFTLKSVWQTSLRLAKFSCIDIAWPSYVQILQNFPALQYQVIYWAHLCLSTVGSWESLPVCLSVWDWTKSHWKKIQGLEKFHNYGTVWPRHDHREVTHILAHLWVLFMMDS